jgi:excisionase family DNA binding protein
MDEMTIGEAAERSGYSEGHLRRLVREGKIDGRRVGERMYLIDTQSLARYIDEMNRLGTRKFDPTGG